VKETKYQMTEMDTSSGSDIGSLDLELVED
jgi:hypothetical protein